MSQLVDFTNCLDGYRDYGGSDNKISIEYNEQKYMLKLPEEREKINDLQTSHVNNVLSEYIGSHIIESIGLDVHKTILGTYNGKLAVACRDFTGDGYKLQEFSWMMRSMYDKSQIGRIPTYRQIYDVMENHHLLKSLSKQAISRYWDTFVVDALIGNFDRHKGNWGYLVNEEFKDVKLAPIYDCGSCLYPGLSESGMKEVLSSRDKINERIYVFPKFALNKAETKGKEEKFTYHELLYTDFDKNCTQALKRIYPRIDINKINSFIENIPVLSDQRIEFYTKMINCRKEILLDKAIEHLFQRLYQEDLNSYREKFLSTNNFVDTSIELRNESFLLKATLNDNRSYILYNIDKNELIPIFNEKELTLFTCMTNKPDLYNALVQCEKVISKTDFQRNKEPNILER